MTWTMTLEHFTKVHKYNSFQITTFFKHIYEIHFNHLFDQFSMLSPKLLSSIAYIYIKYFLGLIYICLSLWSYLFNKSFILHTISNPGQTALRRVCPKPWLYYQIYTRSTWSSGSNCSDTTFGSLTRPPRKKGRGRLSALLLPGLKQ